MLGAVATIGAHARLRDVSQRRRSVARGQPPVKHVWAGDTPKATCCVPSRRPCITTKTQPDEQGSRAGTWCSLQVRKVSIGTVSSAQPRYVTLLMCPFMSMSERRATCLGPSISAGSGRSGSRCFISCGWKVSLHRGSTRASWCEFVCNNGHAHAEAGTHCGAFAWACNNRRSRFAAMACVQESSSGAVRRNVRSGFVRVPVLTGLHQPRMPSKRRT